jgi:hypothetical protein
MIENNNTNDFWPHQFSGTCLVSNHFPKHHAQFAHIW